MFYSIRVFIHNYFLKRELKHFQCERAYQNYDSVKSIGILMDATHIQTHLPIHDYAKKLEIKGKKVKILGYINSKDPHNMMSFPVFTKKDLNWYLCPKSFEAMDFAKTEFDLLINAYIEESIPLQYLSSISRAKYRVGRYFEHNTQCNDFMINLGEPKELDQFLNEVDHYLS